MGIVDLITALGKVATERSQANYDNYAAIDTSTGRPMTGDTRMLPPMDNPGVGGFITDVIRASQDRMTSHEAAKVGMPDAQGLSREQLSDMLKVTGQPLEDKKTEAQIGEINAQTNERNAKSRSYSALAGLKKDPDFAQANVNLNELIAKNPLVSLQVADPETRLSMLNDQIAIIKSAKKGKTTLPAKPGATGAERPAAGGKKTYTKPEDIRDDNSLSREQKISALHEHFPNQFK